MSAKQIIALVQGGIGNQLFIYAASRAVALRNNAELLLITDHFNNEPHGRQFLLDNYSIDAGITNLLDTRITYDKFSHALARKVNRYLKPLSLHHPRYLIERPKCLTGKHSQIDKRVLTAKVKDHLFLDGLFMDESYFMDVQDVIRTDFSLRTTPDAYTQDLATRIRASNSVCIHFRRTEIEFREMLNKNANKNRLGGYKQGLDDSYYRKAMEIIESSVEHPHYYCFSDHPEWVRNNIQLDAPFTIVSENNSQQDCYKDIYLMSQCKHHIISHSSFSWWGAWLSSNHDKIVVAPTNICGRPKPPYYPSSWEEIYVCQEKIQAGQPLIRKSAVQ